MVVPLPSYQTSGWSMPVAAHVAAQDGAGGIVDFGGDLGTIVDEPGRDGRVIFREAPQRIMIDADAARGALQPVFRRIAIGRRARRRQVAARIIGWDDTAAQRILVEAVGAVGPVDII